MATIRVVDLETTGLEPPAEVCELGFVDVKSTAPAMVTAHQGIWLIKPTHPIPPETSAVHHIIDEDVIFTARHELEKRASA